MSISSNAAPALSNSMQALPGPEAIPAGQPLVAVENLSVHFRTKRGIVHAVDGVSFEIGHGETVGLVGETGCGKSVTARSFMRLVPTPPARYASGRILFRPNQICGRCGGAGCDACNATGRVPSSCTGCKGNDCADCGGSGRETLDLLRVPHRELSRIRGERVAMIFQDPALALNPVLTVREQVGEVFYQHRSEELLEEAGLSGAQFLIRRAARGRSTSTERALLSLPLLRSRRRRLVRAVEERVVTALAETRIANPRKILDSYPHELSGGMKQRVMIAQALACAPDLLIADEPTTALDVTIQARILDLIRELQERHNTAVLYISHDLSLVRDVCDRLLVMYAGQLVEGGPTKRIFTDSLHPYTEGLLAAIPTGTQARGSLRAIKGTVPELVNPPSQCRFHTRCPHAGPVCATATPAWATHRPPDHHAACFLHDNVDTIGVPANDMPARDRSAS